MALWQIILVGIAALITIAILIEMYLKRNQPRPPLAKQFLGEDARDPDDAPQGQDPAGIDLEVLREAEMANRVAAGLGGRDLQFWGGLLTPRRKRTGSDRTNTPARRNQEKKR